MVTASAADREPPNPSGLARITLVAQILLLSPMQSSLHLHMYVRSALHSLNRDVRQQQQKKKKRADPPRRSLSSSSFGRDGWPAELGSPEPVVDLVLLSRRVVCGKARPAGRIDHYGQEPVAASCPETRTAAKKR